MVGSQRRSISRLRAILRTISQYTLISRSAARYAFRRAVLSRHLRPMFCQSPRQQVGHRRALGSRRAPQNNNAQGASLARPLLGQYGLNGLIPAMRRVLF
jgi:hypothetical protein